MATKCRCDIEPCAGGCPCSKAGNMCTNACHMGKAWESVSCLNTEHGLKVKPLKPEEVRMALCDAGLSPVGTKNELLKRLAVHYSTLCQEKPKRLHRLRMKEEKEKEKRKKEKAEERKLQETCKLCYRMFANKNSCARHVKMIHHDESVELSNLKKKLEEGFNKKCPHCEKYFKYEYSREDHVNRFHNSDNDNKEVKDAFEEYRCDLCNKLFTLKVNLKRHMVSHNEDPVEFSCEYCDVKMKRKDNLLKHIQRLHMSVNLNLDLVRKQDVFKCKVCSVDFGQDQKKFIAHLVLKSCQRKEEILEKDGRGKLKCDECHRSYADVNSLTRHIAWKHREPIDFKCTECKASFKLKSSLTKHKRQEHG